MLRENVLIPLTILVTILALSYVILLTVYMHIHEMEQLQKRAEKQQEEDMKIQDEMNKPANMIDETLAKIGNNYMPTKRPPKPPAPPPWTRPTTTPTTTTPEPTGPTTESPFDEGFYTKDDLYHNFPPPPPASRVIPFNLYKRNGHLTMQIPSSINLTNDTGHVRKVLEQLNELYLEQKYREDEDKALAMNGFGFWRPSAKERQDGVIWIKNYPRPSTSATAVPTSKVWDDDIDEQAIFNNAFMNRLRRLGGLDVWRHMGFRKRKKRSVKSRRSNPQYPNIKKMMETEKA